MTAADRARAGMVRALRAAGRLTDPAIEAAFRAVPRHLFLPGHPVETGYADEAVAVQQIDGVTTSSASQPSMMAIMLEQLAARPGHRVLEIGAGTGYNAALLAAIVGPTGAVTSVDIDPTLIADARHQLGAAGVTGVELVCADGALGHPSGAPYDRIVLTVGSADVRPEWIAQLAPGGRLLLPLAVRGSQLSVALDLGADGRLRSDSVHGCAFIRLRGMGAAPDGLLGVDPGCVVRYAADAPAPDPAALAAALAAPGPTLQTTVVLGPPDVWDGFGLWLALRQPRSVRLSVPGQESERGGPLPGALFPMVTGAAAPAMWGPGPGLAVVGPRVGGEHRPGPASVRAFGPTGAGPAARLAAELAGWESAGRPRSDALRLVITPDAAKLAPWPGAQVVLPNAVVAASWPGASR